MWNGVLKIIKLIKRELSGKTIIDDLRYRAIKEVKTEIKFKLFKYVKRFLVNTFNKSVIKLKHKVEDELLYKEAINIVARCEVRDIDPAEHLEVFEDNIEYKRAMDEAAGIYKPKEEYYKHRREAIREIIYSRELDRECAVDIVLSDNGIPKDFDVIEYVTGLNFEEREEVLKEAQSIDSKKSKNDKDKVKDS